MTRDRSAGPLLLDGAAVRSARYLRPTRLTAPSESLVALAGSSSPAVPGQAAGTWSRAAGLDLADQLCATTNAALTYEYGITGVRTTAEEAVSLGRGVCQDSAHIMLALCRIRGLAARYVSGHLVGQGGTHAWVEVVVPARDGTRTEGLRRVGSPRPWPSTRATAGVPGRATSPSPPAATTPTCRRPPGPTRARHPVA